MEQFLYVIANSLSVINIITDLKHRTISNWNCVLIALGFVILSTTSIEPIEIWPRVVLSLTTFLIGYVSWLKGWIGAGDVKFLSAIILWVPIRLFSNFLIALAITSLLVGLIGLVYKFYKKPHENISIPYAVPIALSFMTTSYLQFFN